MSRQLFKSTYSVSLMTFISRIMGFIRDMIFAMMFGATLGFDAFLIAFKIPNFLRRLFAEGAFSQAFVPILSEYKSTQDKESVELLINKVAGNLSLVLMGVTFLGMLAAPFIIVLFAPGFLDEPESFALATQMLRITFPYLFFISLTAFAGGILNTFQKFALPAFTPVLLNISLIFAAIGLSPYFEQPVVALAWGVFIGGIAQLALQLPFLKRHGVLPKFQVDWKDPGVRRILKLMLPALIGASVMQINLLVDTLFASFLPVGSLSWLYYSDRLLELPLGMFGVALATVALPNLSKHFATQNTVAFSNHLVWSLKMCILIGLPAAVGLWILSGPILTTLFHHGAFSERDVLMAMKSLHMLILGLVAFMSIKILVSAFYAQQNTKFPLKVAICALLTNVVGNALLIKPLAHAGLALASSLSAFLQVALLGGMLLKQKQLPLQGWLGFCLQVLTATCCMGWGILALLPKLDIWLSWGGWHRVVMLSGLISIAVVVYAVTLWISGIRFRKLIFDGV